MKKQEHFFATFVILKITPLYLTVAKRGGWLGGILEGVPTYLVPANPGQREEFDKIRWVLARNQICLRKLQNVPPFLS